MIEFCDGTNAPRERGAYALLILLDAPLLAKAGGRSAQLAPGRYIYCGSAKGPGGLAARINRHMRKEKRIHWHVDQLTAAGTAQGAWVFPGGGECEIYAELAALPAPFPGFGASDCPRCSSHLRLWPAKTPVPKAFAIKSISAL